MREWCDVWAQHEQGRQPKTDPPEVDFRARFVVFLADRQAPYSGYAVQVDRVRAASGGPSVDATVYEPGGGCASLQVITQPYVIVVVEHTADERDARLGEVHRVERAC